MKISIPETVQAGQRRGRVVKADLLPEFGKLVVTLELETKRRIALWYAVASDGSFATDYSARAYERLCVAFGGGYEETDELLGKEAEFELRVMQGRSQIFYEVWPVTEEAVGGAR